MDVMRLDGFDDFLSLDAVAILEETLEDTTAVVLKNELLVLGTDQLDALIDDCVLLLVRDLHLTLLNKQFIVVNLNK